MNRIKLSRSLSIDSISPLLPGLIVFLLAVLSAYVFFRQPLYSDSVNYYMMSVDLLNRQSSGFYWPLGWPVMMAASQAIFGQSQVVAKGLSFTLGLSTLWLQLVILRKGLPQDVSVWRCWLGYGLIIINGIHILYHANFTFTAIPMAFFGTVLVHTLLFTRSDVLPSILIALMTTVRFGSIFLLPFILIWRWLEGYTYRSLLTTGVLVMLLVSIPVGFVSLSLGKFVLLNTSNSGNLFRGNHRLTPIYETWQWGSGRVIRERSAAMKELMAKYSFSNHLERHSAMQKEAIRQIADRPELFVLRSFTRLSVLLSFDSSIGAHQLVKKKFLGLSMLALMLIVSVITKTAAVVGLLGTKWSGRHWIWALLLGLAFPHIVAFAHPSYSQMFMGVAIPVVALSVAQVDLRLLRASVNSVVTMALVVILCHAFFVYYMASTRSFSNPG